MGKLIQKQNGNNPGFEMIEYLDEPESKTVLDPAAAEAGVQKAKLTPPQILVIDDDPLFRAQVRHIATRRGLPITVCSSLHEMQVMSDSSAFDIAIVDYYLDDLKTHLRGTDIARVLESTPVILISNSDHGIENNTAFPQSVRRFVNKKIGINAILDAALQTAGKSA